MTSFDLSDECFAGIGAVQSHKMADTSQAVFSSTADQLDVVYTELGNMAFDTSGAVEPNDGVNCTNDHFDWGTADLIDFNQWQCNNFVE